MCHAGALSWRRHRRPRPRNSSGWSGVAGIDRDPFWAEVLVDEGGDVVRRRRADEGGAARGVELGRVAEARVVEDGPSREIGDPPGEGAPGEGGGVGLGEGGHDDGGLWVVDGGDVLSQEVGDRSRVLELVRGCDEGDSAALGGESLKEAPPRLGVERRSRQTSAVLLAIERDAVVPEECEGWTWETSSLVLTSH